jgi:hypothetical protein
MYIFPRSGAKSLVLVLGTRAGYEARFAPVFKTAAASFHLGA